MEGREDEVVVAIAVDEKVRLSKGEVHYRLERPTHMNPTSPTTRAIYGVKDNHASRDYRPPPLRTDGFTLVGHSMGGAVSLLVAHRYPDLVEKLVLIGPAGMKFSVPLEMQLMRLPALGPRLFQWFAKQDDMMKEDFMDLEASKSAIAHVMEHTQGMYGSYAFACAFINSFTNFPLRDLEEVIAEVGQHARPSLVMWGEHDQLISRKDWLPRFEEAFGVGRVANHQSAVIADTKHSAFLERPDEAHRIIADFLRGTDHQHDTNDDHRTSKNENEDEKENEDDSTLENATRRFDE